MYTHASRRLNRLFYEVLKRFKLSSHLIKFYLWLLKHVLGTQQVHINIAKSFVNTCVFKGNCICAYVYAKSLAISYSPKTCRQSNWFMPIVRTKLGQILMHTYVHIALTYTFDFFRLKVCLYIKRSLAAESVFSQKIFFQTTQDSRHFKLCAGFMLNNSGWKYAAYKH